MDKYICDAHHGCVLVPQNEREREEKRERERLIPIRSKGSDGRLLSGQSGPNQGSQVWLTARSQPWLATPQGHSQVKAVAHSRQLL